MGSHTLTRDFKLLAPPSDRQAVGFRWAAVGGAARRLCATFRCHLQSHAGQLMKKPLTNRQESARPRRNDTATVYMNMRRLPVTSAR